MHVATSPCTCEQSFNANIYCLKKGKYRKLRKYQEMNINIIRIADNITQFREIKLKSQKKVTPKKSKELFIF